MRRLISATLLSLCTIALSAQEHPSLQIVKDAITAMESGYHDEAIRLLDSAEAIEPSWDIIPYERALAYYMHEDYDEAAEILETLIVRPQAVDQVYSMLGNCYDILGDTTKARETYEAGLKRHPNSGPLYLERGVIEFRRPGGTAAALQWFEKGVENAPFHPSSYYWLAKTYLGTLDHRTWGLLYGETFCLLENDTKRTVEIGELMNEAWSDVVRFGEQDSLFFQLGGNEIDISMLVQEDSSVSIPFDLFVYRGTMAASLGLVISERQREGLPWNGVTDTVLAQTRHYFVQQWKQEQRDTMYHVPLFDLWNAIDSAGHMQTYCSWLVARSEPSTFAEWCDENRDECTATFTSIRASFPDLHAEPVFCRRRIEPSKFKD